MSFVVADKNRPRAAEHEADFVHADDHINDDPTQDSQGFYRYPIAGLFDEIFAPDARYFVPVAPLTVMSLGAKAREIESLVTRAFNWFFAQPATANPAKSIAKTVINNEVDIAKIPSELLSELKPIDALTELLKNINKLPEGGGKVLVRLPGAPCEIMCNVETRFEVDNIISAVSRNGVEPREFPLSYKRYLGNPGERLRKVKHLAERNAGPPSKRTLARRAGRRRKKQEEWQRRQRDREDRRDGQDGSGGPTGE